MADHSAPDRIADGIEAGEPDRVRSGLDELGRAPTEARNEGLGRLRALVDDHASAFEGCTTALEPFLTDEERAVRLRTAKLFVALAESEPEVVVPAVEPLADRLADDEGFYFVRARAAEALGLVALERPNAVASPDVLADLRIGLAFDEPEVREKLAKALECVALGDPSRLDHLVGRLTPHLDGESDLVRYHLCTALVAVGTASPATLTEASGALVARLDDDSPYVRGRAVEALTLLAEARDVSVPTDAVAAMTESDESFVAERARRFAETQTGARDADSAQPTGSLASLRETTESAVEALTAPETDGACPHCGLDLPESAPPMCPRCGAPR